MNIALRETGRRLRGKVKEQWGRLTDDEIDQIEGEVEQLVGTIQKHYGRTEEEAKRELREWRQAENC